MAKQFKVGNPYGTHRVISPKGVLPQPAEKLDNNMEIYDNEVLIDISTLNIDSASFTEIARQAKIQLALDEASKIDSKIVDQIKKIILHIVDTTGKHKNPWTGSGGMLIGTVKEVGPKFKGDLKPGDKIATLVSLSLTPLKISKIKEIRPEIDQVDVEGQAILFETGLYAKLPEDIPENLALSVLDVAGAPAQAAKICRPGQTVVVIGGGGKSGILICYMAKKMVGVTGKVICLDGFQASVDRAKSVDVADEYVVCDAANAVEVYETVNKLTDGELADVVINVVNIPNTEMGSILATKDEGMVYFFSMATSFTKAALGAEGVGKDVDMLMGNGYTKGHAEVSLQILRESKPIRELFQKLYA